MVSLPGDNASNDCVVTTPYATASNAHTTAISAPWSDRKLDTGTSLDSDNAKRRPDTGRRRSAAVYRALTGPEPTDVRRTAPGPVLRFFRARAARPAAFRRKGARRPSEAGTARP